MYVFTRQNVHDQNTRAVWYSFPTFRGVPDYRAGVFQRPPCFWCNRWCLECRGPRAWQKERHMPTSQLETEKQNLQKQYDYSRCLKTEFVRKAKSCNLGIGCMICDKSVRFLDKTSGFRTLVWFRDACPMSNIRTLSGFQTLTVCSGWGTPLPVGWLFCFTCITLGILFLGKTVWQMVQLFFQDICDICG